MYCRTEKDPQSQYCGPSRDAGAPTSLAMQAAQHLMNLVPKKTIAVVYRVSLDPEERMKEAPKINYYDSFKCFLEDR